MYLPNSLVKKVLKSLTADSPIFRELNEAVKKEWKRHNKYMSDYYHTVNN